MSEATELHEMRAALRQLLDRECSPERVRQTMASEDGFDQSLWSHLAGSGWTSLGVADAEGGAGATLGEITAVCEETGAALGPSLLTHTASVSGPALSAALGSRARSQAAECAAGTNRVVPVLAGSNGAPDASSLGFVVDGSNGQAVLRGTADYVFDAHLADTLLVAAKGVDEPVIYSVNADVAEIVMRRTIDPTRRFCRVTLENVPVDGDDIVAESHTDYLALTARLLLARAAEASGGLNRLLAELVDYVKVREQFDRPIGSFQAIKHRLADLYLAAQESEAAVRVATRAVVDQDWAVVGSAKAQVCEAYSVAARKAVQTFGGIGYTWEHNAHLFLKRAELDAAAFGSTSWHRIRAVSHEAAVNDVVA